MNLLITGGSGTLGQEICKLYPSTYAPTHDDLDLIDQYAVEEYIHKRRIDTVIHAAALTDIRRCEENKRLAYDTNVRATRNLIQVTTKYFIYISTACVFSGTDSEPYSEESLPSPKHYYGLTKWISEEIVLSNSKRIDIMVVRTNFVRRGEWRYSHAFTDRFGTYLYPDQIAHQLIGLMKTNTMGICHICGDKKMSMYELAKLSDSNVKPCTLKDYIGPPLTINMSLKSKRISPLSIA